MWQQARGIASGALLDLGRAWRALAITSIVYKAISFAILAPAVALLIRWLLPGGGDRVMADVDIARIFLTTPKGVLALVVGAALLSALTALEVACLMAIGLATARGEGLAPRFALAFGAVRYVAIFRLMGQMILRILVALVPFVLAAGLVYRVFLHPHDINYYLAERPPSFWTAAAIAALIAAALAALIVRTLPRWALALPLVIFEGVSPLRALGVSAGRSAGRRGLIAAILAAWAAAALALGIGVKQLVDFIGASLAPVFAGSIALLLVFVTGLVLMWAALALAVAVVQSALFSLAIVRIWLEEAEGAGRAPAAGILEGGRDPAIRRIPPRIRAAIAVVAVAGALGVALLALLVTRGDREVLVIAHRGASAEAPENTLAAFRLAADQDADFIELDVQESSDGEVIVAHDSDLMKVGGPPAKIWESTAAELRAVDIGSHAGERFAGERVPTLAEALEVAKGKTRVIVELKSYGHDRQLEERVAAIVEAAGMEEDCWFMSLDHHMVGRMKRLRPEWRVGVLAAKTLGDAAALEGDFLAVSAGMVNARFVRRAHRSGRDVYVWTVNDPVSMLRAMSLGADGLITDVPAGAREVVERRNRMSDAQRLLVALLIRLGARTEVVLDQ